MTATSLTLTDIDGEPRIHDLLLGQRLGFAEPRMIRKLIKRHEPKLLSFGPCSTVERVINGGNATEFYLNRKQSIFIVMKSETDNAFEVQADIVRVYDAHLNGGQPASVPQTFAQALRLAAEQQERIEQQQRELEAARPKVAFHDQVIPSESLMDFAQAFSLLHGRTGQNFSRRTFLSFLRRHGIACHPNPHTGIGTDRFVPRRDYTGTWFVSEMTPAGHVEWLLRPLAIAGIVSLIEQDRLSAPIPATHQLSAPSH